MMTRTKRAVGGWIFFQGSQTKHLGVGGGAQVLQEEK